VGKLRCQLALDGPSLDLRVVRFEFRERLSEMFAGDVLFEAPDPDLDLGALLWTAGTVRFYDDDSVARCFSGVIEEAAYAGEHRHGVYHYRVRLLPQVHALAYRVRSRIFQNKNVETIVKEVCTGAGLPDANFVWRTEHPTYPEYEFRTQYKESELAFVCRCLAEEGIFFWFEHDEAGHTMHIADTAGVHVPIEPEVLHTDVTRASARQLVTELHFRTQLVRDAYLMRDWDWMSPQKPVEAATGREGAVGLVHYEYPGGFSDPVDGGRHAEDRLTAEALDKYVLTGSTNHLGLAPGRTFMVDGARPGHLDRGYLLIECTHSFDERGQARGADTAGSGDARARDVAFRTHFVAVPDDAQFRPLPLPKPKVFGIESAVITSGGEEIHVDEWGRVKLHMHWDREGKLDDSASCWVRVQQQNLSGSMLLPRIGWEVAVGFLDADPDRPIVLQKLYNRETLPPYELPANLSQTALQSASSPGGGGTNELRLQDADGGQGFAFHAQRDFSLGVGHDADEKITNNLEEVFDATLESNVGIDEAVEITGNQKVTVKGAATLATGVDKEVTVTAMEDLSVKAIYTTTVDADRTETIGAAQSIRAVSMAETFSADHAQTVGAALALTAIDSVSESVAGNKMLNVGGAYLIKAKGSFAEKNGAAKLLVAAASNYQSKGFTLSAKAALMIKAGAAIVEKITGDYAVSGKKIAIDAPDGATIDGGGTKVDLKGGKLKLDGSKFGIKAGPMLTIKGKIVYR
jgi:type VI secretion system secreted protein VgrG